jgi:hypothetical protein
VGKRKIVTTSGKRSINAIKKELAENGFVVDQVFEAIGSITGEVADDKVDKLKAIDGVADVEDEHDVGIGPPDSTDTW